MKILETKKIAVAAAIFLMLSTIAMTPNGVISTAKAQLAASQPVSGPLPSGVTVNAALDTVAFLSFRPNPIGYGQALLVNLWITPGVASNNRLIPQGFIVTIVKPDGTKEVKTMDSEPATAAIWFELIPDQVGTWQMKFEFIGTYFPAGYYYDGKVYNASVTGSALYGSAYYRPSSTEWQNLTVQQEMIASWPPATFPTDYWTRPANLNNREWWPILGNYPGTGYQGGGTTWDALYPNTNTKDSPGEYNFVPWVTAPNTAHIVWSVQRNIAGIIGGPAGQYGISSSPGNPSVIYSGRCYQTLTVPINGVPTSCACCYDLQTGKMYYSIPIALGGVTPSYIAYLPPLSSSNTIAGAELGSSTWSVELLTISNGYLIKINPNTGAITGNYSISPLTTSYGGSYGCYYNQISGYVISIQDLGASAGANRYRLINWTTRGTSTTLAGRMISNVTWPFSLLPTDFQGVVGVLVADFNAGIAALVTRDTQPGSEIRWGVNITAYSLMTGQPLGWKVVLPDEATYSSSCIIADHGKVAFLTQRGVFLCYDLQTGALTWKSEQMEYPWAAAGFGAYAIQSAYGMLFRESYAGVYAFNWTNGKIVWNYKAPAYAAFESPYIENGTEDYCFNAGAIIADGKMYTYNAEHSATWPLTRGWGIHCINITTGEGIWTLKNPMICGGISDGYLTAANDWDGTMYVFGKGLSTLTVTAPNVVVPQGNGVVIQGTVLDKSPAQPNTPCVTTKSMQTQMEYLHLQQPIDGLWHNLTITGVPVTLTAIDPNGNSVDIGTVTSDGYYGTFSKTWTPQLAGDYKIIASFAGDDSYGSSSATTALSVAPENAATATPTATPLADIATSSQLITYITAAAIAIIIAIALATVLLLRKR